MKKECPIHHRVYFGEECHYCKTEREALSRKSELAGSVFDSCVNMDYPKIFEKIEVGQFQAMCDDREGMLTLTLALDGDMHISVRKSPDATGFDPSFRARTFSGGGQRQRVRDALMLLALAITEDPKCD